MPIEAKTKKTTKPVTEVTAEVKVAPAKKTSEFSVAVYSLTGVADGSLELPKELFGAPINNNLLAQAMRVYMNNQKGHYSNTKTRGEVEGSTRKIYRQKGTGKARHGAVRAPIFVGGGIALGPKYRKTVLELPQKMKKAALISALSQKLKNGGVMGVSGLEKASGKTKEMAVLVQRLADLRPQTSDKKPKSGSMLIVAGEKHENADRAVKNIQGFSILPATQLNAFEVIAHQNLVFTKEAIVSLTERLMKGES